MWGGGWATREALWPSRSEGVSRSPVLVGSTAQGGLGDEGSLVPLKERLQNPPQHVRCQHSVYACQARIASLSGRAPSCLVVLLWGARGDRRGAAKVGRTRVLGAPGARASDWLCEQGISAGGTGTP